MVVEEEDAGGGEVEERDGLDARKEESRLTNVWSREVSTVLCWKDRWQRAESCRRALDGGREGGREE